MKSMGSADTSSRHRMKLVVLTAVALSGCGSGEATTTAGPDCTRIVSSFERLACFDAAAGTPPVTPTRAPAAPTAPSKTALPYITELVIANETGRLPDETSSRITRSPDMPLGQEKVVISAPALTDTLPPTYLAISCLSNISRLQLLSPEPLSVNYVTIRFVLDGKPLTSARPWQVLDDGTVSDAGRGLVAIEQLRPLARPGEWLQIESDHGPLHGLRFDARALAGQLSEQREACHW